MSNAAVSLLSRMLFGVTETAPQVGSEDEMTLGLDSIEPVGEHGVATEIVLATGDKYRVSVEWLREESP